MSELMLTSHQDQLVLTWEFRPHTLASNAELALHVVCQGKSYLQIQPGGGSGNQGLVSLPPTPAKRDPALENKISEHWMNTTSWTRASIASVMGNLCTSLLGLYGGVNKHVDKGEPVGLKLLDFQKVFYKMPH